MTEIEETNQSMYTIMRDMDLNTKLIVPIENWALARNYACQLESDFDVKFFVRRMRTDHTKKNFILIERVR